MPAPAALLAGLGLAALLLFSGSKKAGAATPGTKPLDPNMPPDVDAKFKQALATIKDPAILDQLANSAELAGFPNTAAAFRSRAAQIRGQIVVPGVPVPPAPPPTAPPLPPGGGPLPPGIPGIPGVPGIPGFPLPPPIIPGVPPAAPPPPAPTPIENLDPNLPPAIATSVATLLAKADWSEQELATADALANTLEKSGFPIAAGKLRAKAISIRALHAGAVLLDQITKILTTPPGQLPPGLPTSLPGTPPIITIPPTAPPGAPPPSAPLAKTYKVASGDNPSKIAQMFTGNAANFRQLAAANPDKSARILAGTIYVGEILTLPDAWPAKPQFSAPTAPPPSVPVPAPAPSALAGPHATIRRGSSGADVVLWQKIVGVTADGQFGPNTESATRTWQSQRGLTADGIVGPMTWTAAQVAAGIAVATTVPPGPAIPIPPMPTGPTIPIGIPPIGPRATIQQGSTGPDVVLWQTLIGVTPDGKFGPATAAATKTWQSQRGITPDGIVGPMTWAAAQRTVPVVTVSTPAAVPTTRPPLAVAPTAAPVVPPARPPLAAAPVPMPAVPAPPSPPPAASRSTLKQGSSGPDVILWQKVIGVATDGKFGPGTAVATKTWQTKHGLPADGIVGPKTWAAALGPGSAVAGAGPTYEVQPNDTPFTIARRFTGDGTRMFELAEVNPEAAANIRNGIVFQGQALNLPGDWHVGYEPAVDDSAIAGVLDIIGASHGRPTHSDHWGG